jgi:tetratricopeptide (TPR) repeat protein
MKYFILFIAIVTASAPKASFSQGKKPVLTFDKRLIDGLDKWIVLPMNKDSTFIYGFVYLDNTAGLTFNLEGSFKIDGGKLVPTKDKNSMIKTRLEPSNRKVGIIDPLMFKELEIEEFPWWYKNYNSDPNSIDRLYRLAFVYNEWNECALALPYLERVKAIDPNFKGLKTEFAFAYNALGQFDKAIVVLKDALKEAAGDCYLYKELVYAQTYLGLADDAKASAIKGIASCNSNGLKGEMAFNVAYQYFKLKDKEQFQTWATETEKWAKPDSQLAKALVDLKIKMGN